MALGVALAGQQPIFSGRTAHSLLPGPRPASSSDESKAEITQRLHTPLTPHEAKLTASDADVGDQFGTSIAIFGERALVGAYWQGNPTYVFERQADGTWAEQAQLTASDGDVGDGFGISVALSGERALIGAAYDEDLGGYSGSAYVFERQEDGTWIEEAKLTASDGDEGDYFGRSVALSGEQALIGAYRADGQGATPGSAYVFERQADGTWAEQAKLTASDGKSGASFGYSVALSGERALIGAWGDIDQASNVGSAYVFERQADGSWAEQAKLTASDGNRGDRFGDSVALSGERAVIGAEGDDSDEGIAVGSAYVFERQADGTWAEQAKLTASDGADYLEFGYSVALSGERALIGAVGDEIDGLELVGSAYVFERQGNGTWTQRAKLTASDGAERDRFGHSGALSGERALIGANGDDIDGMEGVGSAYVFALEGCVLELRLDPAAVRAGEELRIGILLEHNRAETVAVPLRLWVEDAAGGVIAGWTTPPITFDHGDTRRRELTLEIPEGTPPGSYRVLVGIERMQQGLAAAAQPFQVVEPSALYPSRHPR